MLLKYYLKDLFLGLLCNEGSIPPHAFKALYFHYPVAGNQGIPLLCPEIPHLRGYKNAAWIIAFKLKLHQAGKLLVYFFNKPHGILLFLPVKSQKDAVSVGVNNLEIILLRFLDYLLYVVSSVSGCCLRAFQ